MLIDLFGNTVEPLIKKVKQNIPAPKITYISSERNTNDFERVSCNAISINPFYVAAFTFTPNRLQSSRQKLISEQNLISNKKKVDISKKAQKNLYSKVAMFIYSAKKRIYQKQGGQRVDTVLKMITLTLSSTQRHSDIYIKSNLLDSFIDAMVYNYGLKNYIWKAEKQRNGNIHFHILVDKYIPYIEIQNKWNIIQAKHGYLQPFYERWGHTNPHSTEIKNGKKSKNLASYISKYFSKKPDGDKYVMVEGRTWFCSKSLQGLKNIVLNEIDHSGWITRFQRLIDTFQNVEIKCLDQCKLFFFNFMASVDNKDFNYFDTILSKHILKL